ncbi:MAG: hypothetical protein MJK12_04525 [Colwellia sp.]|nr:hypothetical protein [Colwellia sp.]
MKLSRAAWNNVIIISVMILILLINLMNHRLFPDNNEDLTNTKGEQLILSSHAVILTLEVRERFLIERSGQSWRIVSPRSQIQVHQQAVEQMITAWQQSSGLIQADSIEVSGQTGIDVLINVAGKTATKTFTLYPLVDQLLIHDKQLNRWLALPPQLYRQLIPVQLYPI